MLLFCFGLLGLRLRIRVGCEHRAFSRRVEFRQLLVIDLRLRERVGVLKSLICLSGLESLDIMTKTDLSDVTGRRHKDAEMCLNWRIMIVSQDPVEGICLEI